MMSLRVNCECDLLSIRLELSFDILAVGNGLNLGSSTHTACLILFSFSCAPDNLGLTAHFYLPICRGSKQMKVYIVKIFNEALV